MTLADIMQYSGKASEFVLDDDLGNDAVAREHLLATMLSRIGEMRDSIHQGG